MKKTVLVVLAFVVLCCSVAVADTIDVVYNNIQVYINGSLTEFTDSNGNDVEPFIYNGNVYLPLPAVAEAMGVGYSWDGSTMSAYLGAQPGESQYLLDVCPPYQDNRFDFVTKTDGTSFNMAGQKYTNGMKTVYYYSGEHPYALFNLNGQYTTMSFVMGHVDDESMQDGRVLIYLDGKLADEYEILSENLPTKVTVSLNNALSMKIVVEGYYGACGIAEITIE